MAERYTAMLRSHTGKNTLDVWRAYADCFNGERLIRCGDLDTGLLLLRPAIDELWRAGFVQYHTSFGPTFKEDSRKPRETTVPSERTLREGGWGYRKSGDPPQRRRTRRCCVARF
jgi:hypothetical protein